jgi:hypothetical protein
LQGWLLLRGLRCGLRRHLILVVAADTCAGFGGFSAARVSARVLVIVERGVSVELHQLRLLLLLQLVVSLNEALDFGFADGVEPGAGEAFDCREALGGVQAEGALEQAERFGAELSDVAAL